MNAFEELPPDEPLPLLLIVKGWTTSQWESLAKAAIPMLIRPQEFPQAKREQLAQSFRQVLQGNGFESDFLQTESFAEENAGYEPGECLDWPEWEEV